MSPELVLSFKIYFLAAAISMAVAAVIKLIGLVMARSSVRPVVDTLGPVAGEARPDASVVAAVSAAIATVIGSHRIVHIAQRGQGRTWASEGRSVHHGSHDVSRHTTPKIPPKSRR